MLTRTALASPPTRPLAEGTPAKDPTADPDVRGAQRLFSAWAEGQLRARGYPGMAVGVVSDERLVCASGFGLANLAAKTPMTPQTKSRMASHSKLFTATAIMQLREQG
ncbi:MAG: beta-lactamase family protein [Acidobacteria bacterium]|nr:beta-lactamase family protein [Acidobacteriota bacterium]